MKLVNQWYKKWSVWLLSAATVLAGLETFVPDLQQVLPSDWYQYAFVIILVARIIKQASDD